MNGLPKNKGIIYFYLMIPDRFIRYNSSDDRLYIRQTFFHLRRRMSYLSPQRVGLIGSIQKFLKDPPIIMLEIQMCGCIKVFPEDDHLAPLQKKG